MMTSTSPAPTGPIEKEPIRLVVDIEVALRDFGIYELYEDAGEELARRVEVARDALVRKAATPAERARLADIEAVLTAWGPVIQGEVRRARAAYLRDEWASIVQSAIGRAAERLRVALVAAEAAERQLYVLWGEDQAAYREAIEVAYGRVLAEQGFAGELEFVDPSTTEVVVDALYRAGWESVDSLYHACVEVVETEVPLPMTGVAPDWSDGTPADALRRAGLTYLERATASQ